MNVRRARFDVLEIALVCAFVGVVAWAAAEPDDFYHDPEGEGRRLQARYGPASNSEFVEEWVVRDFFQDRRGGFFLDVGAADYRTGSNTYFLERSLGWKGIAVEPLTQFEGDYVKYRPRTLFRAFFASDESNALARLYVLEQHTAVSSSNKAFTEGRGQTAEVRDVPTITLTELLDAESVTKIDFLSMDIELAEPRALAGFEIARFRPELVCIEAHLETRQAILDYFADHGYVVIGKYLRADLMNLYFMPRRWPDGSPAASSVPSSR